MPKFKSLLLISLFSFFVNIAFSQLISVPFDDGFIGSIGANTQQANSTTSFTSLGISKSSFIQQTTNGIFYYTQGNDIGGKLRIYFTSAKNVTISGVTTSKSYIDIDGAIVWRGPGGGVGDYYGFLPSPNTSITFNYGVSSTYTISRSSNGSTGSNIGNLRVDKTLSLSNNESGNAAGVVDDLNAYLTTVRSLDPTGPVTVNSQTTTNQTPTITGTATLNAGETLSVTINGVVYSVGDGNLSISGTTWTLVIPSSLAIATYSVEAIITNSSGFTLTDGSSDELVIYSPTLTVNGSLKTFSSCSGCSITPQSFSVSGSNLATNNLVVTAPTGVVVSTNSASGFASSVTLTPTSGTVTTTTIYAKLSNNSTSISSGVISVTSTGATSKTITVTTNTDNALSFSGSNNLNLGSTIYPSGQQNFTIEFWVKPVDATSTWRGIVGGQSVGGQTTRPPSIYQYGRKLHFDIYSSSTSYGGYTVDALNIGQWNHVVFYKNGTTLGIYVNGVPTDMYVSGFAGSTQTTKTIPSSVSYGSNYSIGYIDNYFNGSVDDVRFWNTVRTSTEITDNMYVELAGNETGLLANLKFNQGTIGSTTSGITITAGGSSTITPTASSNIDIVAGFIPSISATGSATSIAVGNTLQLSNSLTGGTWSSSNTSFATVNSSGLVTGVASGSVTITYAICDKTVSYALTVTQPTITTTGTLKTFTSCSGCTLNPQNFSVSGSNLGANITLTAPTGVVLSTTYSGTYSSSLTLTQTSGSVTTTTVYVKLSNNSTSISTGVISVTSTGASSKTMTVTVNTDNALMFDGDNDNVTLPASVANGLTNFTFETWVNPSRYSSFQRLFDFGINTSYYMLFTVNNGKPLFGIATPGNFPNVQSRTNIPLNSWSHLAVVLDASAQTATIYINGQAAISGSMPLNPSSLGTINTAYLGTGFYADPNFQGKMDEVRIWSTARTASEIANNYQNELVGDETGLVAYYNMNQGIANGANSGLTTLNDRKSTPKNGTLNNFGLNTGATSNFVDGFVPSNKVSSNVSVTNNALSFDGSNDYVVSNLNGTSVSAFTIEAFINPSNTTQSTKGILQWADQLSTGGPMVLFQQNGTQLSVYVNAGYNLTTTLSANTWSHIALTYSNSLYTLYVNGASVATYSGGLAMQSNALKLFLGNGYNGYWDGYMDEVRVWNFARTSSEINSYMYSDLSGTESGLMAYYNMNQGVSAGTNTSITSLIDKTANALNGSFNNMPLSAGYSSNFVMGNIKVGTSATISAGGTIDLDNSLTNGTWSTSNSAIATVNSSTGLVTGVAAGTVSISYTICGKTIDYSVKVIKPTLTVSGTLKTFTSCSGCNVTPQSFNLSGVDLSNNVLISAPTGFELSQTSGGVYSSTLTLSSSSVSSGTLTVFVRLVNNATTASGGNILITSTGAESQTISTTVNTDNALNFDGVNDYVIIPDNNALDFSSRFTIESWIYPKSNSGSQVIIGKINELSGQSSALAYAIRFNAGSLRLEVGDGSTSSNISTNNLQLNKWQHIAGVFDNGTLKLYIDGVLQANGTSSFTSLQSNNATLKIGAYAGTFNQFFNGILDKVKIWNNVKTQSEISNDMYTELNGNESGLVAYYDFDNGTPNGTNTGLTTLTNKTSTSSINGTLTNFALTGSTSNYVVGSIQPITGTTTVNVGTSSTLSNTLTGGTWSSANTAVATVNSSTGAVTGVAAGTSTITYTICDKTVNTIFTVTVPTITTTGTLTAFSTCATTNSAAQTFTVSAQNLTANLVLTAPSGYEIATSSGGTYSSTISITPTSGSVSARLIYVRTTTSAVNGQSGNIVITSTGATTKNVATGNAVITQNKTASVTITSNATNNTICSGTSITFTANTTNGGSTPTYQWQLNGSNISGATGATYTTSALSSNSTVTAIMTSSISTCLSGSPATSNAINVIVNSVPNNPGAISGSTAICMNSNQVYSISAVTGATSYTWVVTGNLSASVSSTTNVLNITASNSAGSGTITVYANNVCGTSVSSSSITVTVSNTPAPTASFTVTGNNVCLTNAGITFTSTSSPNVTTNSPIGLYSWTFGDGNSASTTNASNTYLSSGDFDAILTIQDGNQCTSSYSSRITVSPVSVAGAASAANATICDGSSTSVSLTGYTGNIQWQSSTDGTNWSNVTGATSANLTTGNLTTTTYYKAIVTSGACSSATSGVVTVTVSPTPTATLASVANLFTTSTSFDLGYSNAVGSPDEYSITAVAPNAMPSFTNIINYGLLGSPITVTTPASNSGTYNFNLTLRNNTLGCTSANIPFTVTVAVQPPSSLSYNSPNIYTVGGGAITPLTPSSTGGTITQYTIGPSLPAGLTIDPTTGVISGTPTAASSQTTYTVTGTNAGGTVTATVVITVNVQPPASLSYNTPNVYTVGTTISALNPTSTGGTITQYTIGPSLPAGLTINPTTGVISGTPTAASSQTSYTVTGTNAAGTITTTVVITVNVAAPASLSYNTPNVYTLGGGAITALNPTSTGGTITQYTIGPSLPAGLSINPATGVISGTPTAASGQTTYTVTGTNSTGSVTATLVITVNAAVQNNTLPQGGISAVDYKLFASDTVKLKVDITAGTSPYTLIISNNKNTTKDTISSVANGDILNLKSTSSNTIYTLFKITDNGGSVRSSGFTKDTTGVTIVAPNIALTLKADKAVKQPDNSFKTKLLLKIKNSGQIDLKNVQVNANLSEVFPKDLTYKLDSVKLVNGNIRLSSNYQGNGTSTTASSVKKGITASSGIVSNAVLDANYLFDNGVNLAIDEEANVDFYLSIAPTTSSVVLKLQFSSSGDGVLPKSGGYTSQQSSTAVSDDGTNLATHPNNTNIGTPNPTYLPLFPVEVIGAALKASNPTPVTGGYTFDFMAKAKSLSNMNLDTVAIFNDFSKTFTSPDTAYIIGTPVVTGNAVYNVNFNGYSNTLLIDSAAQIAVGDSITVSYKLFVGTTKTSGTWTNSIYASGHSSVDYNYVWDISTDGTNPDPNGDGDTKEEGKTYFYINYTPPAPPKVENKTYVFGTPIPSTIENLVKEKPSGTIPVWCDVQTAICSPNAPATPTIIGKYYYQLKSYDTTTKLYSIAYVNDTVIIKPPVPIVNDSTYIIGVANNPFNVSVQVKAMTGGTLKYFLKTILLNAVPALGNTPSVVSYTVSQVVNSIESDTASFKVTLLHPNDVMHLQKIAGEAVLQSNSSFNIPFTFIARNVLNKQLDSVLITDNLMNSIASPGTFSVVSLSGTGGLVTNTNFNGKTDINVTTYASKLIANAIDTIKLVINVIPNGYSGILQNTAILNAKTPYGKLSMNSSSKAWSSSDISKTPTPYTIPDLRIDIPEGFSPNRDGVNDKFVIIKPYGTILELEVFNRWGNIVYTNPNYNNEWDGRGTNNFLGQELLDGGYYYTLKAKSPNGNVQIFKGFVLIQR
jgi:gliding motility-associated-like protein